MRRKNTIIILFALVLTLLIPGMETEAKTKPKLAANKKTMTVGRTYKLKLKGVSAKAKVKWKTSKKSVVSIAKKKGNTVTLKAKKKGTAVVTAAYKKKQYKCKKQLRQRRRKKLQQIIRH